MKKSFIFLTIFFVLITACKNEKKVGEKVVLCPNKPLKGNVILQVKKVLSIDSLTVDKEKQAIFNLFVKDKNDSIYISDNYPQVGIYKFAKDGTFIKKILNKGEGPGELQSLHFLQSVNNRILVGSANKICEYDLDGNYISEKRFNRQYQEITMIDKQYFIANYQETENDVVKRVCSIINKNDENEKVTLLETDRKNIGQTILGEGEMAISLQLGGITPDYISKYNTSNDLIYQCLSDSPDIYVKNRNGEINKTIKIRLKNWVLTDNDKDELMKNFVRAPDDFKKTVRNNLPVTMLAIKSIHILPKGYFAVNFYKNWQEHEIRLFTKDGQFEFTIEFPAEFKKKYANFTKNGFAFIDKGEERDIYVEYHITNLPEIFEN